MVGRLASTSGGHIWFSAMLVATVGILPWVCRYRSEHAPSSSWPLRCRQPWPLRRCSHSVAATMIPAALARLRFRGKSDRLPAWHCGWAFSPFSNDLFNIRRGNRLESTLAFSSQGLSPISLVGAAIGCDLSLDRAGRIGVGRNFAAAVTRWPSRWFSTRSSHHANRSMQGIRAAPYRNSSFTVACSGFKWIVAHCSAASYQFVNIADDAGPLEILVVDCGDQQLRHGRLPCLSRCGRDRYLHRQRRGGHHALRHLGAVQRIRLTRTSTTAARLRSARGLDAGGGGLFTGNGGPTTTITSNAEGPIKINNQGAVAFNTSPGSFCRQRRADHHHRRHVGTL